MALPWEPVIKLSKPEARLFILQVALVIDVVVLAKADNVVTIEIVVLVK